MLRGSSVAYDPFSIEMKEDPYPTYRRLRDEWPVHYNPEHRLWSLSRYDDVQAAARDWRVFSSTAGADLDDTGRLIGDGDFLDADPPRHDLLRRLVRDHFTPKAVNALAPQIRKRAYRLLSGFAGNGEADVAESYAWPLPAAVVCDLLGFPESDHRQLLRWFADSLRRVPGQVSLPPAAWQAADNVRRYFADAAEERRRKRRDDILSTLVEAVETEQLSHREMSGICYLIFLAGIETTASLISNALLLLYRHPDQRNRLASEPALMANAIEELLRFESPVQFIGRVVTREVELHKTKIPAGGRVVLIYASANRDWRKFPDPDRLDVSRIPARHLAFGEGIHHCIGAPLARLESRLALEVLLSRIPSYEVAGPVQRMYTHNAWGLERLPVVF